MNDELLKETIINAITEQVTRLRREIIDVIGRVADSDCGCFYDQGCCKDKGCCSDKGCCATITDIDEWIEERYDILEAFIRSSKEPVRAFFKARGVELHL